MLIAALLAASVRDNVIICSSTFAEQEVKNCSAKSI